MPGIDLTNLIFAQGMLILLYTVLPNILIKEGISRLQIILKPSQQPFVIENNYLDYKCHKSSRESQFWKMNQKLLSVQTSCASKTLKLCMQYNIITEIPVSQSLRCQFLLYTQNKNRLSMRKTQMVKQMLLFKYNAAS